MNELQEPRTQGERAVELTDNEVAELVGLLAGALGDLSMEISNTDNAIYRASLRSRQATLTELLIKLRS